MKLHAQIEQIELESSRDSIRVGSLNVEHERFTHRLSRQDPLIRAHNASHASFPKTLETIWHLPSLGKLDMTAPAMTEFLISTDLVKSYRIIAFSIGLKWRSPVTTWAPAVEAVV